MPIVLPTLPEAALAETSPYCVIAKHRAKPGRADAYERRMLADLENTRAEPGALQFHVHRDRFDRDLFVIYEVWRDVDALRAHFEKPYVKQFVVDSAEYIEGNMEISAWSTLGRELVGRSSERQLERNLGQRQVAWSVRAGSGRLDESQSAHDSNGHVAEVVLLGTVRRAQ